MQTVIAGPASGPYPAAMDTNLQKVLLIIVAFILPPVAVGIKEGLGGSLLINILLTLLLWLPGFIHAVIVVLR
jgi:uncharacterized membrane protein YqaE (UPF0057 family)